MWQAVLPFLLVAAQAVMERVSDDQGLSSDYLTEELYNDIRGAAADNIINKKFDAATIDKLEKLAFMAKQALLEDQTQSKPVAVQNDENHSHGSQAEVLSTAIMHASEVDEPSARLAAQESAEKKDTPAHTTDDGVSTVMQHQLLQAEAPQTESDASTAETAGIRHEEAAQASAEKGSSWNALSSSWSAVLSVMEVTRRMMPPFLVTGEGEAVSGKPRSDVPALSTTASTAEESPSHYRKRLVPAVEPPRRLRRAPKWFETMEMSSVFRQVLVDGIIVCAFQLMFMALFGWIYGAFFTYDYGKLRKEPAATEGRHGFSFGLFDGFGCDPDWRICCCSCFCLPVRWADTASSHRVRFMEFWLALFVFALLITIAALAKGASMIAIVILAVLNRQRIRRVYNMPYCTCDSLIADTATWCCCSPCATMQEAMEVEFVEPAEESRHNQASRQQMMRV